MIRIAHRDNNPYARISIFNSDGASVQVAPVNLNEYQAVLCMCYENMLDDTKKHVAKVAIDAEQICPDAMTWAEFMQKPLKEWLA